MIGMEEFQRKRDILVLQRLFLLTSNVPTGMKFSTFTQPNATAPVNLANRERSLKKSRSFTFFLKCGATSWRTKKTMRYGLPNEARCLRAGCGHTTNSVDANRISLNARPNLVVAVYVVPFSCCCLVMWKQIPPRTILGLGYVRSLFSAIRVRVLTHRSLSGFSARDFSFKRASYDDVTRNSWR